MVEAKKYSSVKRFGPRYGRKIKERFGKIESVQRKKQKCPYCAAVKVKRLSMGIWQCRKCNSKFTGKAYSITEKIITRITEKIITREEPAGQEEVAQNG